MGVEKREKVSSLREAEKRELKLLIHGVMEYEGLLGEPRDEGREEEYKEEIIKLVSVKMPVALIQGMDELVRKGDFESRSHVIRYAVAKLLRETIWR